VPLGRLVEVDGRARVADVQVENVVGAVVRDVVEDGLPDGDVHGNALRANAVRIRPTPSR
jgi:hypothetical protein